MSEPKDLETLLARVTERRRELLTSVVNRRTRHFCMVLEDLFDPHNISAVIRTAEVFGIQDVHMHRHIYGDNIGRIKIIKASGG